MGRVTIHEAKTQFSKLIRRVEEGEEITVCRGRAPVARLVPLAKPSGLRGRGALKGEIRIADDFDAPLADFAEYE